MFIAKLAPLPAQDTCTAFFSEARGPIPTKPHKNITWANVQCGKGDGGPLLLKVTDVKLGSLDFGLSLDNG